MKFYKKKKTAPKPMIRLVIVLRTQEEIKECLVYNKCCAPVVLDSRGQETRVCLPLQQSTPDFWSLELEAERSAPCPKHQHFTPKGPGFKPKCRWARELSKARPHRRVSDIVFLSDTASPESLECVSPQPPPSDVAREDDITHGTAKGGRIPYSCSVPQGENSASQIPEGEYSAEQWWVRFIPMTKCTMLLNGHLASCIVRSAASAQNFRRHLLKNLIRADGMEPFSIQSDSSTWADMQCDLDMEVTFFIDVVAVWPEQRLDYPWSWYLNHLLTKRMLLEETMAWLSTLGGAHSSLGEYFTHHAEMAGRISIKQLRLALNMGDTLTVARCHMFWAFSLLQRGYSHKAKAIVRRVHRLATTYCVRDVRLVNMCLSAWSRLQHLHRLAVQRRRMLGLKDARVAHISAPVHGEASLVDCPGIEAPDDPQAAQSNSAPSVSTLRLSCDSTQSAAGPSPVSLSVLHSKSTTMC